MMNPKRRLSLSSSAHKLKLDSVNKILKFDRNKKQKKDALDNPNSKIALAELLRSNTVTLCNRPPDFKTFLTHEENVAVFKEFLRTQHCQENLEFYLACERYRNLDTNGVGRELAKFIATQIYNDYLSEIARQPVNVNNARTQVIKENLKDPGPELLCDAQAEIFELMRTDCYPRFCKTWQLERDSAIRILQQAQQSKCDNSTSIMSFTSEQTTLQTSIASSTRTTSTRKSSSRRSSIGLSLRSQNSSLVGSECPPECPYFRVGRLPCQRHKEIYHGERIPTVRRKLDPVSSVDYQTDLKRIHRPPTVCTTKTGLNSLVMSSPPPPLPPKPDEFNSTGRLGNKKYQPYVGKVFNV